MDATHFSLFVESCGFLLVPRPAIPRAGLLRRCAEVGETDGLEDTDVLAIRSSAAGDEFDR